MIKFDNVSKKFGSTNALVDINLEIKEKDFIFVVGRSGCGKTTLFRLLNREFLPTSGKIIFQGNNINKISDSKLWMYRRKLGLIFQDMKLLTDRTVFENVALALEFRGEKNIEIKKKVEEILDLVGIGNKQHQFPKELSGGEIQRVGIARAFIGNPDIILADEPTADLDVATAWEIIQILQTINKFGKTVLMATHNIDIVNSLQTRVILLENGKIAKDVTGEKIKI